MHRNTYEEFLATFGLSGAHPGGFTLTKKLLQKEKLDSGLHVLDVGCGTGQTSSYIASQYHCTVTALDHNPLMLQKAKERFAQDGVLIYTVEGDLGKLPFNTQAFDFIISESVVIFTSIAHSLQELSRVLKQQGTLLITEMTAEQTLAATDLSDFKAFYGIKEIPTEQEWLNALQRSGLKNIQILQGESVASTLAKQVSEGTPPTDWMPSKQFDPQLYEVGYSHHMLTQKYADQIGYRVYRAVKA